MVMLMSLATLISLRCNYVITAVRRLVCFVAY